MTTPTILEKFLEMRGTVTPLEDDVFSHEFDGRCVGVRCGCLQVRDQDDNVYEVDVCQFEPVQHDE